MFLSYLVTFLIVIGIVHCAVQFQYDSEQCLGELVEYQCTVTGSQFFGLKWTILQDDGIEVGLPVSFTSNGIEEAETRGVFRIEQLSFSPSIVSNISFTVQSSINGYTIICEDGNMNNMNFTIGIPDPPSPPDNLMISLVNEDILVNWTQPTITSQCITIAAYIVNTTSTIISTTDTSVTIPLAGLSPGIYCVSVASVDTANRTGTYSEENCLRLNVPSAPNVTTVINDDNVLTIFFNFVLADVTPSLSAVSISNNQSGLTTLPPSQTTYTIPLEYGVVYNITIYGENILGMGLATSFTTSVSAPPNVSMTPTMSNTSPSSDKQNNNTIVAVSVSLVLVFVFLIVAAICAYTLACAVRTKRSAPYTVSKRTLNKFITDVRDAAFGPCLDLCATPPIEEMTPEEYTPEKDKDGTANNDKAKKNGKKRKGKRKCRLM